MSKVRFISHTPKLHKFDLMLLFCNVINFWTLSAFLCILLTDTPPYLFRNNLFALSTEILRNLTLLLQKTVVSVELLCSKCRQKVMKLIAMIEGITSIVLDPSKNTVTVVGEADPVKIINKVRKFRKSATILSVGPPKDEKKDEKDQKKDVTLYTPKTCERCDVWYVINYDPYHYCSIM